MTAVVDAMTFKRVLELMSTLDNKPLIRAAVVDDAFIIKYVEPSNVMMCSVRIPDFVTPDVTIAIDTERALKAIGRVYKSEPHNLSIDFIDYVADVKEERIGSMKKVTPSILDTQPKRMRITTSTTKHTLEYNDPSTIRNDPKIPDLGVGLCNHVNISTKLLKDALEATFGKHARLCHIDGDFVIRSDDAGDDSEYRSDMGVYGTTSENGGSLIDIDRLIPIITKLKMCSDTVDIGFGIDYPIIIKTKFGKDNKSSVQFLIAPRINTT